MKPGLSSAGLQTVASALREVREELEADNRLYQPLWETLTLTIRAAVPVAGYMPPVVTSPGTLLLHARHYRVLTVTLR